VSVSVVGVVKVDVVIVEGPGVRTVAVVVTVFPPEVGIYTAKIITRMTITTAANTRGILIPRRLLPPTSSPNANRIGV